MKYKNLGARLVVIYRPPPSKKNNPTSAMCFDDFSRFYEQITLDGRPLVICDDFNIHVDNTSNREACQFTDFLESANLVQHVSGPTHRRGHTLDLIITRKDESLIKEVEFLQDSYSDHRVVTCKLNLTKPPRSKILVTSRSNKAFDLDKFRLDISDALSQMTHNQDTSVDGYNKTLCDIYNAHFPLPTRWVTQRPRTAWHTYDLRTAKRKKRRAERKFRKAGLVAHKQLSEESCATYNSLLESTKCSYYRQTIENANTGQLFKMVDGIFAPRSPVLPTHDSLAQLVENFNDFFIHRIHGFREELQRASNTCHSTVDKEVPHELLSEFNPASYTLFHDVIKSLSTKSCPSDPMPTRLLKDHLDLIVPVITTIVNESSSTGVFPTCLKHSLIRPLLKKNKILVKRT